MRLFFLASSGFLTSLMTLRLSVYRPDFCLLHILFPPCLPVSVSRFAFCKDTCPVGLGSNLMTSFKLC